MADDLSLLFKLKAQNQASTVIKTVQSDVEKLGQSATAEFKLMESASTIALGKISSSLTNLTGQIPLLGNSLNSLAAEAEASSTSFAELLGSMGPVGIAIAGIAIEVAGAAIVLGTLIEVGKSVTNTFLGLAKSAAGFRGELFDLSQQTGVSVETLSTLSAIAETTGSNIQSITASLGIFQKNLEAAQDPTTKQAAAFKALGVETNNTEDALRQALASLAKMPEGFKQTALALELFGRGGKSILAILKEMHGDLDGTTERLRKMGLVISTEDAEAADKFNDQLRFLELRFRALLGKEVIPGATEAIEKVGQLLDDNKDDVKVLSDALSGLSSVVKLFAVGSLSILINDLKILNAILQPVRKSFEDLAAVMQLVTNSVPNISPNAIPVQPLGGGNTTESLKELQKLLQAANNTLNTPAGKPFNLQEIFGTKNAKAAIDPTLQLIRQLQGELRNLEGATKAETIAQELLDTKYKNSSPALKEQALLLARIVDQKIATKALDERVAAEQEKSDRELQQAKDAERETLNNFIAAQTRELQGNQTALQQTDELIRHFQNLSGAMDENQKFWLRFRAEMIDSTERLKELKNQLRDVGNLTPAIAPNGIPTLPKGIVFDDSSLGLPPEAEKHFKNLQSTFDDLGNSIGKAVGASKDFGQQFGDVALGAVSDLASGIGDLIEQYVLLGSSAPNALRKLLAATLAHLAAESAVKAVFQLAEAFASLAIGDAFHASQHFTSAAIFGSIAGVAAVAGRAAAGDLFKPQASGSTSGSAGPLNTTVTTTGRNQPATIIQVVVKPDGSKFGSAVDAHLESSFGDGGPLRELVLNDGRAR